MPCHQPRLQSVHVKKVRESSDHQDYHIYFIRTIYTVSSVLNSLSHHLSPPAPWTHSSRFFTATTSNFFPPSASTTETLLTVASFLGLVMVYTVFHYANQYIQNPVLISTPLDLVISIYDAIDPSWALWRRTRQVPILGLGINMTLILTECMTAKIDASMEKVIWFWEEAQISQKRFNNILVKLIAVTFQKIHQVVNRISVGPPVPCTVVSILRLLFGGRFNPTLAASVVTIEKVSPSSPKDIFSTPEGLPVEAVPSGGGETRTICIFVSRELKKREEKRRSD
ncbi:hypothetical protein BDD12DRAFT_886171 [Trichophaea hybrida]|nr:hypothetical protein BDD12DRAFT_886171 [Trichophaea hybrida]